MLLENVPQLLRTALVISLVLHGVLACFVLPGMSVVQVAASDIRLHTLSVSLPKKTGSGEDKLSPKPYQRENQNGISRVYAPNALRKAGSSSGFVATKSDPYLTPLELDALAKFVDGELEFSADWSIEQPLQTQALRLLLLINSDGQVDEVVANVDDDFSKLAITAIKEWQFDPAMKDGKRVNSSKLIELTLDPLFRFDN